MGASPRWKVYTFDGEYVASTSDPVYAAMVVAGIGHAGTTIRDGHSKRTTVFTDGMRTVAGEVLHASESFDRVAEVCQANAKTLQDGRRLARLNS